LPVTSTSGAPAVEITPQHLQPKRLLTEPARPVSIKESVPEEPVTLAAIQRWLDLNA
jgi:hypothetical protein